MQRHIPIQEITNLSQSLVNLPAGSWVFLDIDDTLLLQGIHKYHDAPRLTENGLADELSALRARGIKVIGLTARKEKFRQHTEQQLAQLRIVLDDVVHAPSQIGDAAKKQLKKGSALQTYLETHHQHPQHIFVVDNDVQQLNDISEHITDPAINVHLKHYTAPQYQPINLHDAVDQHFPKKLNGFKKKSALGGGTNSVFSITHDVSQQELVLKSGAHTDAAKIEMLCNIVYRVLGVHVPEMRVYRSLPGKLAKELGLPGCDGMFQVSEMIAAHQNQSEKLISAAARQDFVAHVLLGNIDIAKPDNFIIDQQGKVCLIDAGANFMFRAKGSVRKEDKALASEIDTLRDKNINALGATWFGSLTDVEIAAQVKTIAAKHAAIEAVVWEASNHLALPEELRHQFLEYLSDRLDQLVVRFNCNSQLFAKSDKKAHVDKTAAGVLTCSIINGKPHILLSKRVRHEWWDNFGGQSKVCDTYLSDTARREVAEESAQALLYTTSELQASPFHDIVVGSGCDQLLYRMYITTHQQIDARELTDNEHTEHQYLPLAAVLAAVDSAQRVTMEGKETIAVPVSEHIITLYPPLYNMLRQPQVYNNLRKLVETRSLQLTRTLGYAEADTQPTSPQSYRPIVTPDKKRQEIAATLQQKSRLIRTLKRPQQRLVEDKKPENQPRLSQSEIHLKAVLGNKYREDNLEENVRSFVTGCYSFHENLQKAEDKERLIRECVDLITNEKTGGSDQVYFYHACNNEVAFIYDVYTALYQALHADEQWQAFRPDSEHFKRFNNIAEFMDFYSDKGKKKINNNEKYFNDCALSTNVFLFGNHEVPTSHSISYLIENEVRRKVDLAPLFANILRPFHLTEEDIGRLIKVFAACAKEYGGTLYQIAMPREQAHNMAYPAGYLGKCKLLNNERDLSNIFQSLQEKDLQDPKIAKFVRNLQARVLVPPHLPLQVKTVKWRDTSPATHAAYQKNLQHCVRDIFEMMMRHRSAYHANDRHTSMVRLLPSILAANQLSLPATINETMLARAILASDVTTIRNILTAFPEFKARLIAVPQEYIDTTSSARKEVTRLTPAQMMLRYTKLTYADIALCYGEGWLNFIDKINIYSTSVLTAILSQFPENQRLELMNHPQLDFSFRVDLDLLPLFDLLPVQERLIFFKKKIKLIVYFHTFQQVFAKLPAEDHFKFAIIHDHMVSTGSKLAEVLGKITDDADRYAFAQRHKNIIFNAAELSAVLLCLPISMRLSFMNEVPCAGIELVKCLTSVNQLSYARQQIRKLPLKDSMQLRHVLTYFNVMDDRLIFAKENADMIEDSMALGRVTETLDCAHRYDFILSQSHHLQNGMHLVNVLEYLNAKDALALVDKFAARIESWHELFHVMKSISSEEHAGFAQRFQQQLATTSGLSRVMGLLPSNLRLAFATANASCIRNVDALCAVLRMLDASSCHALAMQHLSLIKNSKDILPVLDYLSPEHRLDYIGAQKDLIQTGAEIDLVMVKFSRAMRLELTHRYPDFIRNGEGLYHILPWLPENARMRFALKNFALISVADDLGNILGCLPYHELLPFVSTFLKLSTEGDDLHSQIYLKLPQSNRYEFVKLYFNELLQHVPFPNLLILLPIKERPVLVENARALIQDWSIFCDVLKLLPESSRQSFAEVHIHKITNVVQLSFVLRELPNDVRRDGFTKLWEIEKQKSQLSQQSLFAPPPAQNGDRSKFNALVNQFNVPRSK